MKKRIFLYNLLFFVFMSSFAGKTHEPADIFKSLGKGDKLAILMVHFGTTYDDTRALTIDAINQKAAKRFPGVEVREAYSSRIIIKRLSDRGMVKLNPHDALKQLYNEGYTHVLVQPTTIINGLEMESLTRNVRDMAPCFKEIRLGTPLLYYVDDYAKMVDVMTQNIEPDVAYLWVGHGTYHSSTAQYAMLDYMLKEKGYKNVIIGCIEGYPFYEQAMAQLRALGMKKVKLMPLMFVAGDHAQNDIAEDWKTDLEEAGFDVELVLRGLGQIEEVQNRYIEILAFNAKNRRIDIMDKKKVYQVTGEKMEVEE